MRYTGHPMPKPANKVCMSFFLIPAKLERRRLERILMMEVLDLPIPGDYERNLEKLP